MATLAIVSAAGIPSQSESDERKVKRLRAVFEDSRAAKEENTTSWAASDNFYRGRHWDKARPSWKASPRIPLTYAKTETVVPIMTDSRPRVHLAARSPRYQHYADAMQKMMDYEWIRQGMDQNIENNTRNCLTFGDGFLYPWYDTQRERPVTNVVSPKALTPDAMATSVQDARVLMHRLMMPRSEILRRWPDVDERQIIPGARFQGRGVGDISPRTPYAGRSSANAISGTLSGTPLIVQDVPGTQETQEQKEVEVIMFLVRDQETIEADAFDPISRQPVDDNGNPVRIDVLKFPHGRLIVVAGEAIIVDEEYPYQIGRWNYIQQMCHPREGHFWSTSFVENLVPLNKYANKLLGLILDNAALMSSGQWKMTKNSMVDPKMLTGEPGLAIEYMQGANSLIDKIPGVPLPAYVMDALEMVIRLTDDTSGVFDVTQGKKPVGITAGVAIEQLQEAGHTRVRLLTRHQEDAIRQWGEITLSFHQQFLTRPKLVRIHDPESGEVQFIPITPEMVKAGWEIEVVTGSTLPRSRDALRREAMELFAAGLFDKNEALEWMQHPGAQKLLGRLKREEQLQAALALQGVDGGGGNGAAPVQPTGPPLGRRPQVSGRGGGFNNQ